MVSVVAGRRRGALLWVLPVVAAALVGGGTAWELGGGPSNAASTTSGTGSVSTQNCGNCQGNSGSGGGNLSSGNPGHTITVTGVVSGKIAPGVPATLTVTINNTNNQAIVVTNVTGSINGVTSAGQAGKPVCSKSWYSLGSFSGSKPIAQNSSGSVVLPVTFSDLPTTNQDNCKGATYSFTFTATANQA
jgi:hypothetical protein